MSSSANSIVILLLLAAALVAVIFALGKMARREEEAAREQRRVETHDDTPSSAPFPETSSVPTEAAETDTKTSPEQSQAASLDVDIKKVD